MTTHATWPSSYGSIGRTLWQFILSILQHNQIVLLKQWKYFVMINVYNGNGSMQLSPLPPCIDILCFARYTISNVRQLRPSPCRALALRSGSHSAWLGRKIHFYAYSRVIIVIGLNYRPRRPNTFAPPPSHTAYYYVCCCSPMIFQSLSKVNILK